jgi:hypothetical protein
MLHATLASCQRVLGPRTHPTTLQIARNLHIVRACIRAKLPTKTAAMQPLPTGAFVLVQHCSSSPSSSTGKRVRAAVRSAPAIRGETARLSAGGPGVPQRSERWRMLRGAHFKLPSVPILMAPLVEPAR